MKLPTSLILLAVLLPSLLTAPLLTAPLPEPLLEPEAAATMYLPLVANPPAAPRLKWQYGGCYDTWCETGWYSSPAVADINHDGLNEIIASAYSVTALDGSSGALIWRSGTRVNRTWPGIVSADLDRDGTLEFVVAQHGGMVTAYRPDGSIKWQKQPSGGAGEFRGLLAADLDGDGGNLEVIVTRGYDSARSVWVLDAAGNTRPGWPQLALDDNNPDGYGWGVYNANAAAGNFSGDARLELVVPSDVHYINLYQPDGSKVAANPTVYADKKWGQVGIWESTIPEERGWGLCNGTRIESYRTNFADGPAVIADVDGNGVREVVVVGNMYDCHAGYPPSRYMALYIFNADHTRFNAGGFDWRAIPVDTGAPLSEDYNRIENVQSNAAVVDLDGDGRLEAIYPSYDGRMHAFWLDKDERLNWPYSIYRASEGFIRFASEPAVVDLENDGFAEVIFASWTQKGSRSWGKLHILNWAGAPIHEIDLPAPKSSSITWNGGLAAPTIANVDADADLEVVLMTSASGVVVYDLPGTANARILWSTGRGGFTRQAYR